MLMHIIILELFFKRKGQVDNAVSYYEKALQHNPTFTEALVNLGIIFQEKGQFDKAINYSQQALQINPNYSTAYINLGNMYCEKGQINEAIIHFQKAIKLDGDNSVAHVNLAFALFSSGDLKRGWREYEWRWKSKEGINLLQKYAQPIWTGFDISGCTILLHDEPKSQAGFGDAIQFIRYAPLIAKCGAKVIFECKKELISLLKNVEGIYQIIELGEQLPFFDVHCFLLDLPFIFDISLDNIPSKIPYISIDPSLIQKWTEKTGNNKAKFKVGLVWAAEGLERSCPVEAFTVLGQISDSIKFYSLQKGVAEKQTKNLLANMQVVNLTEEINDFSDTAALIENLDLVVSVDTAVAHLAGALGKPVWILVPFVAPWRWMLNREDSPWYPTMRLFRQPSLGDWESVIAKVKDELFKLLDRK